MSVHNLRWWSCVAMTATMNMTAAMAAPNSTLPEDVLGEVLVPVTTKLGPVTSGLQAPAEVVRPRTANGRPPSAEFPGGTVYVLSNRATEAEGLRPYLFEWDLARRSIHRGFVGLGFPIGQHFEHRLSFDGDRVTWVNSADGVLLVLDRDLRQLHRRELPPRVRRQPEFAATVGREGRTLISKVEVDKSFTVPLRLSLYDPQLRLLAERELDVVNAQNIHDFAVHLGDSFYVPVYVKSKGRVRLQMVRLDDHTLEERGRKQVAVLSTYLPIGIDARGEQVNLYYYDPQSSPNLGRYGFDRDLSPVPVVERPAPPDSAWLRARLNDEIPRNATVVDSRCTAVLAHGTTLYACNLEQGLTMVYPPE